MCSRPEPVQLGTRGQPLGEGHLPRRRRVELRLSDVRSKLNKHIVPARSAIPSTHVGFFACFSQKTTPYILVTFSDHMERHPQDLTLHERLHSTTHRSRYSSATASSASRLCSLVSCASRPRYPAIASRRFCIALRRTSASVLPAGSCLSSAP